MKRRFRRLIAYCAFLLASHLASAQAIATATGPGTYVTLGGGLSAVNTDYGRSRMVGVFTYVDINPEWHLGLEAELRSVRWNSRDRMAESSYLAGVRAPLWSKPAHLIPYAKFLAGAGEITLPFKYAHGSFLAYAPGAGLELAVDERLSVRLIDVEYQHWPAFSYGALSPYSLSSGISFRLNSVPRYPKTARLFRR